MEHKEIAAFTDDGRQDTTTAEQWGKKLGGRGA
jgi:hypothetical protein